MQVKLWEVESKLRNLYSPKPQDQQIDVCIIDTGQLVCQSLSVLPSQSSGSLTLHCHLWRCQCPMKTCHLPLPAGILQRELEGQYWSMWGQWNPTRGSALRLPVEPPLAKCCFTKKFKKRGSNSAVLEKSEQSYKGCYAKYHHPPSLTTIIFSCRIYFYMPYSKYQFERYKCE